jgi:hypothetical protein
MMLFKIKWVFYLCLLALVTELHTCRKVIASILAFPASEMFICELRLCIRYIPALINFNIFYINIGKAVQPAKKRTGQFFTIAAAKNRILKIGCIFDFSQLNRLYYNFR